MSTGACGIDCTVCRLHVEGLCSTCGAGTSEEGKAKLEAQRRLFGTACGPLRCACQRGVSHCMRDCAEFPCAEFSDSELGGRYPFGQGFLDMQRRRRARLTGVPVAAWPEISVEYWDRLNTADPATIVSRSGATRTPPLAPRPGEDRQRPCYRIQSLGETWLLDPRERTANKLQGRFGGEWDRQVPFPILVYLVGASVTPAPPPVGAEADASMVSPRELYPGIDAFQGKNALHTAELESAFGNDGEAFARTASQLGGRRLAADEAGAAADVSVRFSILPKIPVDYLLWLADSEFEARLTLLLDRETPRHLPADVCAVLVNLLSGRLLLQAHAG
jgi:hypothetical protein